MKMDNIKLSYHGINFKRKFTIQIVYIYAKILNNKI